MEYFCFFASGFITHLTLDLKCLMLECTTSIRRTHSLAAQAALSHKEIKLTSSDVKTTTFNMTASKTYTLDLLGEWSGNDMAILASKLKKGVSTECNIILDDYFEEWINNKRLTIKENTICTYTSYYYNHISSYLGKRKMQEII